MNAKDIVILVCEKKAPAPYWTHTRGIYADLSDWPRSIDYYVKCPECGNVHGFYPSLADAHSKRLCPTCDYDRNEKLKKEVAKLGEAKLPPADEPFDPDIPLDAKAEVHRYVAPDWIAVAKWQLEQELGTELEISEEGYNRDIDVDNPETCDVVYFDDHTPDQYGHGMTWKVWKNEELAEAEALEYVRNGLDSEPENFNQDWLQGFINIDKLRDTLRMDQDNWTREDFDDQYRDYEEKVEFLVKEGKLEEETFYDEEGNIREETPELERLVDQAVDEWCEEQTSARLSDPMDYLREIYPEEEVMKHAMEWGGIDIEAAAQSAVNTDGWQHFISRYDNKSITLKDGAVAVRES